MSPSSYGPRGVDAGGSGAFKAPRRGGRPHEGFDILVRAGDAVPAPIAGVFMRYGFCYADEPDYRYVSIHGAGGVEVRIFYVERSRSLAPGAYVQAGDVIGTAQAISRRYGGRLPDHLHVEVRVDGKPVDPEPLLAWRT
jgi:murein DD-endopeptidase MepM/ murein hydrolase activator NlpD